MWQQTTENIIVCLTMGLPPKTWGHQRIANRNLFKNKRLFDGEITEIPKLTNWKWTFYEFVICINCNLCSFNWKYIKLVSFFTQKHIKTTDELQIEIDTIFFFTIHSMRTRNRKRIDGKLIDWLSVHIINGAAGANRNSIDAHASRHST